jgi:hypothetical protein
MEGGLVSDSSLKEVTVSAVQWMAARDVLGGEASHFTPWLAANLEADGGYPPNGSSVGAVERRRPPTTLRDRRSDGRANRTGPGNGYD